ncbi:hypothetical protein WJX77_001566 [Trebouxia sp. C0004]
MCRVRHMPLRCICAPANTSKASRVQHLPTRKRVDVLGKTLALTLPIVTCWGSHYSPMKALISNERCMLVLALEKHEKLKKGLKTVMRHIGPLL